MWRLSRIETAIFIAFVALAFAAAVVWGHTRPTYPMRPVPR